MRKLSMISLVTFGAACGYSDFHSGPAGYPSGDPSAPGAEVQAGENYGDLIENDWITTDVEKTSTFSIDVDNGSYTLMRNDVLAGRLPDRNGVRIEEYVNYFDYDYPQPAEDAPFSINMEIAPSEFGDGKHMMRIGLKGREIAREDLKPTNLVFLIDTSGSMTSEEKLPLVKRSLLTLLGNLRSDDTIGIVTYAGSSEVLLEPTPVRESQRITAVIHGLASRGATNGEAGIVDAYELAERAKIEGGNNRVILATDGDFNVGLSDEDALIDLVHDYRQKHISLTTIGYGRGNYNDYLMEGLARKGNGNYFYIDTLAEAERIFGERLASTLEVIASDVKIQVEFDAHNVLQYRLVGYENRLLENEDFDDDTKDAGEIGPGHTVTAMYELVLNEEPSTDSGVLAQVRLRHKPQYGEASELQEQAIKLSQVKGAFEDASDGFRFATAVVEFAEILRDSIHSEGRRFDDVIEIATGAYQDDPAKDEFVELVRAASNISPQTLP